MGIEFQMRWCSAGLLGVRTFQHPHHLECHEWCEKDRQRTGGKKYGRSKGEGKMHCPSWCYLMVVSPEVDVAPNCDKG